MDSLDAARAMLIGFHRPVYLLDMFGESDKQPALTAAERDFAGYMPSTVAFTSPTADLWFRTGALATQWRGRGFCCVYVKSPADRSRNQVLGTALHEAGHYLTYARRPDRDGDDVRSAMAYSTENPCNAGSPHDECWLSACVHLWLRACEAGVETPFGDVVNLAQYRLGHDQFLASLREAQQCRGLPLAELEMQLAPEKPQSVHAKPHIMHVDGEMLQCNADGSVETFPDLYDRGTHQYQSLNDFLAVRSVMRMAG